MEEDQSVLEQDENEDLDEDEAPEIEAPAPQVRRSKEPMSARERELYREVRDYRAKERAAFLAEFPSLTEEDIKGLSPEQVRRIASKIVPEVKQEEQAPKPKGWDVLDKVAQAGAVTAGAKTYTAQELYMELQQGRITGPEMNAIIEAGRMTG